MAAADAALQSKVNCGSVERRTAARIDTHQVAGTWGAAPVQAFACVFRRAALTVAPADKRRSCGRQWRIFVNA